MNGQAAEAGGMLSMGWAVSCCDGGGGGGGDRPSYIRERVAPTWQLV